MERPIGNFAFIFSSADRSGDQHGAKAVRQVIQRDLGLKSVALDTDRQSYKHIWTRDPEKAIRQNNRPAMVLTTLDASGDIAPALRDQASAVRRLSGVEIPIFAVSEILQDQTVIDLGSNIYGANVHSADLYDTIAQVHASYTPAYTGIGEQKWVTTYQEDSTKMQSMTPAERKQFTAEKRALFNNKDEYVDGTLGYAIESETMSDEVVYNAAIGHIEAFEYLTEVVELADAIRTPHTSQIAHRAANQNTIIFSRIWKPFGGLRHPVAELYEDTFHSAPTSKASFARIAAYLAQQQELIPVRHSDFTIAI